MLWQHRSLQTVLAVLLAVAVLPPASAARRPEGSVLAVEGSCTLRHKGESAGAQAPVGASLYVGDVVQTGGNGTASLVLGNGETHEMAPKSALEVTGPVSRGGSTSLIRALYGVVLSRVRPGTAVRARSVTAAARGTEFLLDVGADVTTVTVIEGEVEFTSAGASVAVGQSQQSVARDGMAPSTPVPVANPSVMVEWALDLSRAAVIRERPGSAADAASIGRRVADAGRAAQQRPDDAAARSALGGALLDAGRAEAAVAECREAARLGAGAPSAQVAIGDCLLEMGRVRDAAEAYNAALAADPRCASALVGLAWVGLRRSAPAAAAESAARAVEADPASADARIALGIALARQGAGPAAIRELEAARQGTPVSVRYQALAWEALVLLAHGDTSEALSRAEAAVRAAPQSPLAHSHLALVSFHAGQTARAEREARIAVARAPGSGPAQCVLGQCLLGLGDVDGAARVGARAVAFDPGLAEAHYLLGVADAQRRDYRHAERELARAQELAPGFVPAGYALARVQLAMGSRQRAEATARAMLAASRDAAAAHAALGAVLYQSAQCGPAIDAYREAVRLKPDVALYQADLCRVLVDANRLDEAITAGQQAIRLAPTVGQYHAVLALAYDFSRMSVQAEREFREALALDPRNALAQFVLGLRAASVDPGEDRIVPKAGGLSIEDLLKEGMRATGSSQASGSIAQASLLDPAVAAQVFRAGTTSTGGAGFGSHAQALASATHQSVGAQGALHTYGQAEHAQTDGVLPNDGSWMRGLSESATWTAGPRTTLFARVTDLALRQGVPGPLGAPDLDDRMRDSDTYFVLAGRHRLDRQAAVWASVAYRRVALRLSDPDRTTFGVSVPDPNGNPTFWFSSEQGVTTETAFPEVRLDLALARVPGQEGVLSFGATQAPVRLDSSATLAFPSSPPVVEIVPRRTDARLTVGYLQWAQQLGTAVSLAAQMRYQRMSTSGWQGMLGGNRVALPGASTSHWLPSALLDWRPAASTAVRLLYNRLAQGQDLTAFALAPVQTSLITEPLVLPKGLPDTTETVELDLEHRPGGSDFARVFVFHTRATGVSLGPLPAMDSVERYGIGLRYERRLTPRLFLQAGILNNRTTNRSPLAPYNNGSAPYHPWWLGGLGLHYVDASGTKLGLQANHAGTFYQDSGDRTAVVRPRFGGRTYFDLTIAKEPSVRWELYVRILNLFGERGIVYNGYPAGGRAFLAGGVLRY